MIITSTPLRISFFGGGTDYPVWYREHGGAVWRRQSTSGVTLHAVDCLHFLSTIVGSRTPKSKT